MQTVEITDINQIDELRSKLQAEQRKEQSSKAPKVANYEVNDEVDADFEALLAEKRKMSQFVKPTENSVANLKLRPLTAGTMVILRMVDCPLVSQSETKSNKPMEFAVAEFIYAHAGEVKEVRRNCMDIEKWNDAVLDYMDRLKISDFVKTSEAIAKIIEDSGVGADYEVQPEGEEKK